MDEDIWIRMDVVPVEYVTLAYMFHFIMCFFHFFTDINFICNDVIWWIFGIFLWISLWT